MKTLQCPSCETRFVRVTYYEGTVERMLNHLKVFPFRCQLCTKRFRTFWAGSPNATQAVDRRQYKRLSASFHVDLLSDDAARTDNRATDISMGGCTLETTATVQRGTFLELIIKPTSNENTIKVETAMVCSVRPKSMGIQFLEFQSNDKHRLSQVVLSLLVGHSVHPNLFS